MDDLTNKIFPNGNNSVDINEVLKKELEFSSLLDKQAIEELEIIKNGGKIIREDLIETEPQKIKLGNQNNKDEKKVIVEKSIHTPVINEIKNDIIYDDNNIDEPYDLIPLPSKGLFYKNKRTHIKVAYMTAIDEDILTSPNILQSGKFLEILLNRKILDKDIRYNDLLIGDRNAIMIWLRSTAYGTEYPVVFYDDDGNPFETIIDLSEIKYKEFNETPNNNGLFEYTLPISKQKVKIKMLTIKDVLEYENEIEAELAKFDKSMLNDPPAILTKKMEKFIVEINGNSDPEFLKKEIKRMRAGDARALRNFYDKIEPGVDLNITVVTPGGRQINTFLPINVNFFWPDIQL